MAANAFRNESDEAFARRLQAQEMGLPNSNTPLIVGARQNQNQNQNQHQHPVAANARQNESVANRATVCAILVTNVPQIIAAVIVLAVHWYDRDVCDHGHTERWKWWVLISAIRMFVFSIIVFCIHLFRPWLTERPRYLAQATNTRNIVDALGLIWFVVGNIWLFGDDDNSCRHPEKSPIYGVGVAMLIISYIQICLPCIIAVALIPLFCFCMPCLIRALARLQNLRPNVQGATDDIIRSLPVTIIDQEYLSRLSGEEDNVCPVCLSEMVVGEEARLLTCKHIFHKQCVDEWLRVNASCPTCRTSILPRTEGEEGGTAAASTTSTTATTATTAPATTTTTTTGVTGTSGAGGGGVVVGGGNANSSSSSSSSINSSLVTNTANNIELNSSRLFSSHSNNNISLSSGHTHTPASAINRSSSVNAICRAVEAHENETANNNTSSPNDTSNKTSGALSNPRSLSLSSSSSTNSNSNNSNNNTKLNSSSANTSAANKNISLMLSDAVDGEGDGEGDGDHSDGSHNDSENSDSIQLTPLIPPRGR